VITNISQSDIVNTSTGSPQGCVISPVLFSIYVDQLRPTSENLTMIKYADDILVLEKLTSHQQSTLQQEMSDFQQWCQLNHLILNTTKTKEITFSNARDNPETTPVVIGDANIEQVTSYRYLGTTISNKVKFHENTDKLTEKARKKLHIMKKLHFLGTTDQLATICYRTFIESALVHNLTAIYHHLSASERTALSNITKNAEKLSRSELPNLSETVHKRLKRNSLRMVATATTKPLLTFDRLPSGRFRTLRHRINLRKDCFRSYAIQILNKALF